MNTARDDLNGKLVSNATVNSKLTNLDLSNLNPGIYILELQTENSTITEKLIIK